MVSTLLPDALHGAAERSADPPAVLVALRRLREELPDFVDHLAGDAELRSTLVAVFAASRSLTRLCLTDPTALDVLTDLDASPTADDAGQWKSREFLRIAARDLTGRATFEEVGAALADMSDRVLAAAFAAAPEVAVIAMGKFGGRELNYASDVDVMFVGRGDVRVPLEVARRSFRVDADLRPEGRNGPLVRTLNAYRSYWTRWAKTWEFQALLKARPCTGDVAIGEAFAEAAAAAVWSRPFGADEVREVRAMKARVEAEMSRRGLSDRELKRGRGGIRDVEFAVQLLQLVHGGADTALRSPTTLTALAELATAGYVDPADAGRLADTYRFLRMVEHRLQLWDEAQVHAVPPPGPALDRLARVCGYRSTAMQPATAQFMADLRRHQATARTIHERLFFRPLLEAFQGAQTGRGVPERLSAFGFTDAVRTQEALRELTRGLTRTSRLMHQMLPLVLEWLSEAPDPDAGLLGLRTLASGQHRSEALVRMFRDAPDGARRLCLLLGTSRVVGAGLERHPELVADLADPLLPEPVSPERLRQALATTLGKREGGERIEALRRFGQYEEVQIAIRDLLDRDGVDAVSSALTSLAEVSLEEALRVAQATAGRGIPMAVIAMGRFGGSELSYASDLDVMLVHDGETAADAAEAERVAVELRRLVNGATPSKQLWRLDLDLRPEGRQGPLARSLTGFAQYYDRWAQTWERQALLRGRFVAGDAELGGRFAVVAQAFLAGQVTEDDEREIRRMKARIERERIPPSDDPDFHLKLGRGGLADVEWTVQLLQLRHHLWGRTGTLAALGALVAAGHVSVIDAEELAAAYHYCERTRNRLYLVRGAPGDALPARHDQLSQLARSLDTTATDLRDDYRRVTRRCRAVVDRLFYGADGPPRRPRVPGGWPA